MAVGAPRHNVAAVVIIAAGKITTSRRSKKAEGVNCFTPGGHQTVLYSKLYRVALGSEHKLRGEAISASIPAVSRRQPVR
jgi:hypothetical protein